VAVTLVLPVTLVFGQARPGRLNPPHLSEMPTVQRVVSEITAPNPRDAVARQMGAFEQLNEVIAELSMGRVAIGTATPDEERIMAEYRAARTTQMLTLVKTPADEAMLPALRRFDTDPGLRDELLKRFFSPALQAQSAAISRELQARRAALRKQNAAVGGTAVAPAAQPSPQAAGVAPRASAAPPKPLPPDPSIAQARAAKVDTTVFGLQLGDPLNLPQCAGGLFGPLTRTKVTCVAGDDVVGIAVAIIAEATGDAQMGEAVHISLPADRCPAWMSDCTAMAVVENGRLMAISAVTDGPGVEQAAAKELRAKYGTRATARQRFITPDSGAAKFDVWDLFWDFPGLHVQYLPVYANVTKGLLRIETEPVYQKRMAREKEAVRPKL
jgi:hypothetical protein